MEFDFNNLIITAIIIFILGFSFIINYFKNFKVVFFISFIKSSLFLIYFTFLFKIFHFTFLDDIKYYQTANNFFINGNSFFELIKHLFDLPIIFGHWHFIYYMYNLFAFEIFGNFYFAPVALNIILTFIISVFIYKILIIMKFNKQIAIYISIFYLIHLDILTWSTLVNFKDFLVQFFTVYLIYLIIKFDLSFRLKYVIGILIIISIMSFLRFYISYLILFSYILFKIYTNIKYTQSNFNRYFYIFFSLILILLILLTIKVFFKGELNLFFSKFSNPLIGVIRFLLTPLPFHMDIGYEFLVFSSLLNLLFFPFFIYGVYIFLKINSKYKYFIIFYFIIMLLFYGSFLELQGPRHRIQILPFIIIFQFLGMYKFFWRIYGKNNISY